MWDFIVVGSGSGGAVAAARLAELGRTVLLLEAGGSDRRLQIQIPAAFSKLFRTDVDWGYHTTPQAALRGRTSYWPRGKVLGGSSAINAMIYTTGHPHDYDRWRAMGNAGWGWNDVAPVYERLRLAVEPQLSPNPLSRAFVAAVASEGIPVDPKLIGPDRQAVGFFQTTTRRGRRLSSAGAYLRPLDRRRLTIRLHTTVKRLLVSGGRARGVECVRDGRRESLMAGEGVILAGGAINTPHILLASGIGPAEELQAAGVSPVVDLPGVGRNLQDHLTVGLTYRCTKHITLDTADTFGNLLRWFLLRRGPLRSPVAEAGAFLTDPTSDDPRPFLELIFGPVWFANHGFDRPPGNYYTLGAVLLHPESKGTIRLGGGGADGRLRIDPAYLSQPADRNRLREAFRLLRKVGSHEAFEPYRGEEALPGSAVTSDEGILDHIERTAETLYHPVGTCKMGPDSDPMAVVDSRLRVRGVDRLWVADASVMPELVSAHTHAPTVMIGERVVEMMQED